MMTDDIKNYSKDYSKNTASIVLADNIRQYLASHQLSHNLSNISYEILALQLLDCLKQTADLEELSKQVIDNKFSNPNASQFNPIKAILALKDSNYDEASWLIFLLIYTDDSAQTDWAFMRLLYGAVGLNNDAEGSDTIGRLTWKTMVDDPQLLHLRLEKVAEALAAHHPKPKFGHHRAYESLNHLPTVFRSYIAFIQEQGGHQALFKKPNRSEEEKTEAFKSLYPFIRQNIYRFGRLSTFEYLSLLGRTGLADIAPDSCYIADASGPKRGAKLLFGMINNSRLDEHAQGLAEHLDVGYQEMEAALCHWQKSPNRYVSHED